MHRQLSERLAILEAREDIAFLTDQERLTPDRLRPGEGALQDFLAQP
jgi:hypothetical protein